MFIILLCCVFSPVLDGAAAAAAGTARPGREVHVYHCPAGVLSRELLVQEDCEDVRVIRILDHEVHSVMPDAFADCGAVEHVDFSGTRIRSLPEGLFSECPHLKFISLVDCRHLTQWAGIETGKKVAVLTGRWGLVPEEIRENIEVKRLMGDDLEFYRDVPAPEVHPEAAAAAGAVAPAGLPLQPAPRYAAEQFIAHMDELQRERRGLFSTLPRTFAWKSFYPKWKQLVMKGDTETVFQHLSDLYRDLVRECIAEDASLALTSKPGTYLGSSEGIQRAKDFICEDDRITYSFNKCFILLFGASAAYSCPRDPRRRHLQGCGVLSQMLYFVPYLPLGEYIASEGFVFPGMIEMALLLGGKRLVNRVVEAVIKSGRRDLLLFVGGIPFSDWMAMQGFTLKPDLQAQYDAFLAEEGPGIEIVDVI